MNKYVKKILSDSPLARWAALFIAAFAMMMGYFFYDVMSPLETMLEQQFNWTSSEYGFFSGSYAFINVYLLMLFVGGIFLDKFGIRISGTISTMLMVIGALIKFYAIQYISPLETTTVHIALFGLDGPVKIQVLMAALGFSIFGVGSEVTGFTVSKIMIKWFTGHELALAMGIQVSMARLGTAAALALSKPFASHFGTPSASILLGAIFLTIGFILFLLYCLLDKKLDESVDFRNFNNDNISYSPDCEADKFHFHDIGLILKNPGFWSINLICLFFYSAVSPFLKFAAKMLETKYSIDSDLAGTMIALVPFGAIILTPLFGNLYDRIGHGVKLIIIGASLLTIVHILFAININLGYFYPIVLIILFSIAFSLLPSALWPSVPKIIPQVRLGTAYACIFWLQNVGRAMIPILIGFVLDKTTLASGSTDFSIPMLIFACFSFITICLAVYLGYINRKMQYGLEQPNIKKNND